MMLCFLDLPHAAAKGAHDVCIWLCAHHQRQHPHRFTGLLTLDSCLVAADDVLAKWRVKEPAARGLWLWLWLTRFTAHVLEDCVPKPSRIAWVHQLKQSPHHGTGSIFELLALALVHVCHRAAEIHVLRLCAAQKLAHELQLLQALLRRSIAVQPCSRLRSQLLAGQNSGL